MLPVAQGLSCAVCFNAIGWSLRSLFIPLWSCSGPALAHQFFYHYGLREQLHRLRSLRDNKIEVLCQVCNFRLALYFRLR